MDDKESLFSIYNDPDVMRYWSTPPWTEIQRAVELIQRDIDALSTGQYLRLGVELRDEKKLIGNCSLFNFDEGNKRAEIGYILAKEYWHGGFMSEAMKMFIDYGFREMDLHRLEADIDPRNEASARLLTRLGFKKEGHLRERWIIGGVITDSFFFGLLRHEWPPSK